MSFSPIGVATVLVLLCAPLPAFGAPAPREITFEGAGGVRLSGTLLLPEGASADRCVPAVVLVAGSGPTDRNGNQPPLLWTGLLKQLADILAEAGIASLRYDKRGQYRSGKPPGDAKALGEFVAWDHFVADVEAAYRALGSQPEVDPGRLAIMGHSEGGLLAIHAALALQERPGPPAAVVLLAAPGRPLDVVIREQLTAAFRRQGLAAAAAASPREPGRPRLHTRQLSGVAPRRRAVRGRRRERQAARHRLRPEAQPASPFVGAVGVRVRRHGAHGRLVVRHRRRSTVPPRWHAQRSRALGRPLSRSEVQALATHPAG